MVKKILIIGIIILFLGVSYNPSVAINNVKNSSISNNSGNIRYIDGTFMKTFGGPYYDTGCCVQQTNDGGYIISGDTESFGDLNGDVWLIKTDNAGNMVWNRTFGRRSPDGSWCVQQTTDGGYIISGYTCSFGAGDFDVWLIKTDDVGNEMWNKTFGGKEEDCGLYVQQSTDGGYIITGSTKSFGAGWYDVWLIKTNSTGDMIWDKTFGGRVSDCGWFVQQTNDGGYIITGETESFSDYDGDVWLIKTDSEGNNVWNKTFGGTDIDLGRCVLQTNDGGYIISGYTLSFGAGWMDIWLIKTNSTGYKLWDKTFGGVDDDYGRFVQQTTDGGYILSGDTWSFGAGWSDFWLIKTNSTGNMLWNRTFGGTSTDYNYCVQQTNDGGYILIGDTNSFGDSWYDVWLIKTDRDGRPRDKSFNSNFNLLSWLLERFPLLERLLNLLLL